MNIQRLLAALTTGSAYATFAWLCFTALPPTNVEAALAELRRVLPT